MASSNSSSAQNMMADLLCSIMVLCKGSDNLGKPCWAYMCVKPSMAKPFKDAREKGGFNLEEYGSVIEYGQGVEPPDAIKMRMEKEYGMNHHYEDDLLRAVAEIKLKENS